MVRVLVREHSFRSSVTYAPPLKASLRSGGSYAARLAFERDCMHRGRVPSPQEETSREVMGDREKLQKKVPLIATSCANCSALPSGSIGEERPPECFYTA